MVDLTEYIAAICPQQKISSVTALAWHDILGNLGKDECRKAAAAIASRQPFVAPSEIIREIASQRSAGEPHSSACRSQDHGECRFSWCSCACHPANVRAVTAQPVRAVRRSDGPQQISLGDLKAIRE
jgi:hypothetical protein